MASLSAVRVSELLKESLVPAPILVLRFKSPPHRTDSRPVEPVYTLTGDAWSGVGPGNALARDSSRRVSWL